ncbi:MAG TPA: hypothetical protein VFC24_01080 [Casimicrobiaceae bacterium]|nr:hypothetical protein [Casimicrobiaceae bacterium]
MAMLPFARSTVRTLCLFFVLLLPVLLSGCGGGSSASPPTEISATPGDAQVTITWNAESGVDYWIFYAPDPTIGPSNFVNVANAKVLRNASSPQVIAGLTNGLTYYFSINGRTNNGPGGSASPTVSATPRLAGAVWTVNTPLTSSNLNGLAFGAVGFVAVGAGGQMFSSLDGRTWVTQTSGVTSDLNAIVSVNGVYVGVGNNGITVRSTDGVTWTNAVASPNTLYAMAREGSSYVAVGAAGTVVTSSSSGNDWAAQNSGTSVNLRGIAFNGSVFVAVGDNGTVLSSSDLVTWTPQVSGVTATLRSIAFGLTRFVAVGDGGTIITSTDGVTWTVDTDPTTDTLNSVVAGSQFIAAGVNGRILTSPDGVNWSVAASNTTATLFGLAWSGSAYAAVGAAGTNLVSY